MKFKFTTYQVMDEYGGWFVKFDSRVFYPGEAQLQEIRTWCRQSFGTYCEWDHMNHLPPRWKDRIKWGEIIFRDQKDATWLLLKWGS